MEKIWESIKKLEKAIEEEKILRQNEEVKEPIKELYEKKFKDLVSEIRLNTGILFHEMTESSLYVDELIISIHKL